MAVKIKLARIGKIREPHYRIVVADARTRRNGRAIETIGQYHPKENPSGIVVDSERVQYWLGVGAQPSWGLRTPVATSVGSVRAPATCSSDPRQLHKGSISPTQ